MCAKYRFLWCKFLCFHLTADENPGTWNDANCGNKVPFICKKANGAIQPITYPQTPVPVGNCPTGAYKYDNRCYQFHGDSESDRLGWEDARAKCESMGMQLATIHSQQVQCELLYYVAVSLKLGMNKGYKVLQKRDRTG